MKAKWMWKLSATMSPEIIWMEAEEIFKRKKAGLMGVLSLDFVEAMQLIHGPG